MSKYAALSLSEALEQELEGTNVGVSVLMPRSDQHEYRSRRPQSP